MATLKTGLTCILSMLLPGSIAAASIAETALQRCFGPLEEANKLIHVGSH